LAGSPAQFTRWLAQTGSNRSRRSQLIHHVEIHDVDIDDVDIDDIDIGDFDVRDDDQDQQLHGEFDLASRRRKGRITPRVPRESVPMNLSK
jgi:hypothetical protein